MAGYSGIIEEIGRGIDGPCALAVAVILEDKQLETKTYISRLKCGGENLDILDEGDGGVMAWEYLLSAEPKASSDGYCSCSIGLGIGTLQSLFWIQAGRPVIVHSKWSREYSVYHIRTLISFSTSSNSGTSLRKFKPRVCA